MNRKELIDDLKYYKRILKFHKINCSGINCVYCKWLYKNIKAVEKQRAKQNALNK